MIGREGSLFCDLSSRMAIMARDICHISPRASGKCQRGHTAIRFYARMLKLKTLGSKGMSRALEDAHFSGTLSVHHSLKVFSLIVSLPLAAENVVTRSHYLHENITLTVNMYAASEILLGHLKRQGLV